ncbi:hypothetical protein tb265_24710 [Gemmatimonadetes bacterium T265]|nr:hypothetical protein tb265_24710 [Gemmatimonadetes bacterium T265]
MNARGGPGGAALPPGRWDLHSRLSAASAAFVLLALAALVATPLVTFRRLEALHRASEATTVAAATDLADLRVLFTEEIVLRQLLREGDDSTAALRYDTTRAHIESVMAHLARIAPQIGPAVPGRVAALARCLERWHAAADSAVIGRVTTRLAGARLSRLRALRDSTLAAHAHLAAEVQRIDAHDHWVGTRAVADQRYLSTVLGALAAVAAAVVAGFARRERRLTRALARAVDEEHRLRAAAERQREAVVRLGESKARLVRGFTHDVKNPIGAADGYLGLLEDGIPDPPSEAQRRSLERARRSLRAALHLIGDLLEVSRAESGAIDVRPTPTDLAAVARDAAEEYRAQADAKGLRLHVAVDDGVPCVTTDPVRVRQVLGNLVANAVKYTDRGQVVVRLLGADAGRRANRAPRYAIEVADTGPGIAPEHQARLFEEFVRLDPEAAPGVGIGLAISRRIAQALGGDIAVRSAVGRGSTFVLWLPGTPDRPAIERPSRVPAALV